MTNHYVYLCKLIAFIVIVIGSRSLSAQNCLDVSVPQDIVICEPQDVDLIGSVTGNYFGFEWNGTNGFFDDQNLVTSSFVNTTTTFVLEASELGATNLVTNGDFESGNTGFTSAYTFNPNTNVGGMGQGFYNLDVVYPFNWSGANCPSIDGSTMFVTNAAVVPNVEVYCTDVLVQPNTEYVFTVDILTINNPPPILQFSINGNLLGDVFNGGAQCAVNQFYEVWDSGPSSFATICLVNQSTAAGGNDFAMDNVTFSEVCKGEAEFTVIVEDFDVDIPQPVDISCDDPFVTITSMVTPDVGQTYSWSTGDGMIQGATNSSSIIALQAGTYSVTVTGQNGCVKEESVVISGDVEVPFFDIVGSAVLSCDNPSVFLEADLQDPSIVFTWTLPDGQEVDGALLTAVEQGLYTLNAFDPDNNCSYSDFVFISQEDWDPFANAVVNGELDCSTNSVEVNFQIGEPFDDLVIVAPDNSSVSTSSILYNALLAGEYTYTFIYGSCSVSGTFDVVETLGFDFTIVQNVDTFTCKQTVDTLTAIIQGGYDSISWYDSNGEQSSDTFFIVTDPGTYYVEVTDGAGCFAIDSLMIFEDVEVPDVVFDVDTISCLMPNGGFEVLSTSADSILWMGATGSSTSLNPTFSIGGDYTLILYAENGCNDTIDAFLPVSEDYPEITSEIIDINCLIDQGEINISSNLQADFSWSGPGGYTSNEDSILVDDGGSYVLTVTTLNGCVLIDTFEVEVDTLKPIINVELDTLTCSQSTVTPIVTVGSDVNIGWVFPDNSTSDEVAPELSLPGGYNITAQASNGCETNILEILESHTVASSFNMTGGTITCEIDSTFIVVDNQNLNYTLLDGTSDVAFSDSIAVFSAGIYMVTGTNEFGCDTTINIEIEALEDLPVFDIEFGELICDDTTTFIVVDNPNLIYTLDDGVTTLQFSDSIEIFGAGNYMITGTNANGCDLTITTGIGVTQLIPVFGVGYGDLVCDDTTTFIVVDNPDLTYTLFDEGVETIFSDSIEVSGSGEYQILGTNEYGCEAVEIINIQGTEILPTFDVEYGALTCDVLFANVIPSNPSLTYSLVGGAQEVEFVDTISVSEEGDYSVIGTNEWGCSTVFNFTIVREVEYPEIALQADELNCQVVLSLVNNTSSNILDVNYQWSGENISSVDTIIEVESEGWYYLEVINELGCSSLDSIYVSGDFDMPDIDIVGDNFIECYESSEMLSVVSNTSNYESSWMYPDGSLSDENSVVLTEEGEYVASVLNLDNGCVSFDTVAIEIVEGPELDIALVLPDCPEEFGELNEVNIVGGQSPYNIIFDDELLGTNLDFDSLQISDYTTHHLQIIDENGCSRDTFFNIEAVSDLELDLYLDQSVEGSQIIADISFDPTEILNIVWSPNSSLSCVDCLDPIASPSETTDYLVTITTVDGCLVESTVRVIVEPKMGITIPNIFSPNGDGVNDMFTVYEQFESVEAVDLMSIYDRWGNLVVNIKDLQPNVESLGWDGTFLGESAATGVYAYIIKVRYVTGEEETISGTVTLIK